MGLFDSIRCQLPLPEIGLTDQVFQTKDTPAQWTDTYELRADGTLWHRAYDTEDRSDPTKTGLARLRGMATPVNIRWEPCPDFIGEIRFYGEADPAARKGWIEFSAYLVEGKLAHPVVLVQHDRGEGGEGGEEGEGTATGEQNT